MRIEIHVHQHLDRDTQRSLDRLERGQDDLRELTRETSRAVRELLNVAKGGEVPDQVYQRIEAIAERSRAIADKVPNDPSTPTE